MALPGQGCWWEGRAQAQPEGPDPRSPVTAAASAKPQGDKPTSPLFQVSAPRPPDGQPQPQPLSPHHGQKPAGLESGCGCAWTWELRGDFVGCSVSPRCMRSQARREASTRGKGALLGPSRSLGAGQPRQSGPLISTRDSGLAPGRSHALAASELNTRAVDPFPRAQGQSLSEGEGGMGG